GITAFRCLFDAKDDLVQHIDASHRLPRRRATGHRGTRQPKTHLNLSQFKIAFTTNGYAPTVFILHIGLFANSSTFPLPRGERMTAGLPASSSPPSSIPDSK